MIKILGTFIILLFTVPAFAGSIGVSYTKKAKSDSTLNSYVKAIDFKNSVEDIVDLSGNYNYGKTGAVVTTDDGMFSIGYSPKITDSWYLWLREAAGYDNTIGIDFENTIGFGPKYVAYYNKGINTKLSLSVGILYHSISVNNVHSSDDSYSYRLKFNSELLQFVYYKQLTTKDSSDYISTIDSSIKIASFDVLSVKYFYKEKYRAVYKDTASIEGMKLSLEF
ncbi:DUF481 domain-containing protein [Candidatus Pacearchaeota archaeon]|nr:DUF481 domain-containing protein [Candidatus Pacearchaeota archaeon]